LRQETAQNEAEQRRLQAGKAASSKFLVDYLDQEQFLTGTPQDPYTVKKVSDLVSEGMGLIDQGISDNQLIMALSPKVGRLSQETQTLKQINEQKKQAIEALKSNPAINIGKFSDAFDEIYFETDEMGGRKLKDISKLDPSKKYADEVLQTQPVFTGGAVNEYFKTAKPQSITHDVMVTDKRGGYRKAAVTFDTPTFMQPNIDPETGKLDEDNAFIPKFQVAKDGDKEIVTDFLNKQGKPVKAEIRLLDKGHFDQMMLEPGIHSYFMQQAREFAKAEGLPIKDPKVEIFTRAIAYDYADNSPLAKGTFREKEATKAAPETKVNVTVNSKGDKDEVPTIDLWSPLKSDVDKNMKSNRATLGENIPNQQYKIIAEIITDRNPEYKDMLKPSSFILQTSTDGNAIVAYEKSTKNPLATFTQADFDLAANQALGIESRKEAVKSRGQQGGGTKPATTQKPKTLAERMKAAAGKK
jgi:hypothetical protein